jgi:hypothetical protein
MAKTEQGGFFDDRASASQIADPGIDTAELAPGAWLALWGLRYRAALLQARVPADTRFYDAFAANGVLTAARALDALVVALGAAATRPLDLRCPACPNLSADEALLLEACADGACFGAEAARRLTVEFLPPAAARIAAHFAAAAGAALGTAKLGWRAPTQAAHGWMRLAVAGGLN